MEKGFDRVAPMENAITVKKDRHIVSWTPEVLSLFSFWIFKNLSILKMWFLWLLGFRFCSQEDELLRQQVSIHGADRFVLIPCSFSVVLMGFACKVPILWLFWEEWIGN